MTIFVNVHCGECATTRINFQCMKFKNVTNVLCDESATTLENLLQNNNIYVKVIL